MTDTSRKALIRELRCAHAVQSDEGPSTFSDAADMLKADALQIATVEMFLKQSNRRAKREPLSDAAIGDIWMIAREANDFPKVFAKAIEAAHGIGDKP